MWILFGHSEDSIVGIEQKYLSASVSTWSALTFLLDVGESEGWQVKGDYVRVMSQLWW